MRALLIGASAATAVLAFVAPAWAQDPPKPSPDDSAVSQYVEEVPSAWGQAAPGVPHKAKQRSKALPSAIQTRVRATGGTDAAALERNATTPSLGAPVRRTRATPAPRQIIRPHDDAATAGSAFSAAVTAVEDGGGGVRFAVLGIGLLAITAATGFGALRRSRGTG